MSKIDEILLFLQVSLGESPGQFLSGTIVGAAMRKSVLLSIAHLVHVVKSSHSTRLPQDLVNDRNVIAHTTQIDPYTTPTIALWTY